MNDAKVYANPVALVLVSKLVCMCVCMCVCVCVCVCVCDVKTSKQPLDSTLRRDFLQHQLH